VSRSVNAKEQKQILADINAGSQKFGRKLLAKPPGTHRRGKSNETITPVTVLSPELPPEQEERRGRRSTNSQRPKLPKRTSSMKRAYNYFFGGHQAPPSPTTPVTAAADTPSTPDGSNTGKRDEPEPATTRDAPDTPPETPGRETHPSDVPGKFAAAAFPP
jgi:hypothetical protein